MARILLVGGHGKIALLAEPLLVSAGHEVTAVIRNPDHAAAVEQAGVTPLVADVETMDVDALAAMIQGHDAIVWSAGAGGGNPARTRAVDQEAAIRSMRAASQAGVRRYVMVSYFRSSRDHGVDPDHSFYAYADAKSIADEVLRASDLNWTVLGPSSLTLAEPTGKIDTAASESGEVSRANVARVIVEVLQNADTVGHTIRFNDGDMEIPAAIAAAVR